LNYGVHTVHPAYDSIELLPLAILQLSWACMSVKIIELPDFEPTEYLFKTHKDKGSERWEIYAWALREAMMKAGNLKACNMPLREKICYEEYMQMNPKYKTPFFAVKEEIVPLKLSNSPASDEKNTSIKKVGSANTSGNKSLSEY